MAELSLPWSGTVTGDAGAYTFQEWSEVWRILFTPDDTDEGVVFGKLNALSGSDSANKITIGTGYAIVDGTFYENDAAVDVTISTPSVSTRVDTIVLRKDSTAQTVRITNIAGVEGVGPTAITQVRGTTWDLKLFEVSITTGAVITITDFREFIQAGMNSDHSIRYYSIGVVAPDADCATGNGKAFFSIPPSLDGMNLVSAHGVVFTAGTTSTMEIEVYNKTDTVNMLTTEIRIETGEVGSDTATLQPVIDTANDDVASYDRIQIDIDVVHTTAAKGLVVTLGFQLP